MVIDAREAQIFVRTRSQGVLNAALGVVDVRFTAGHRVEEAAQLSGIHVITFVVVNDCR
jgi:hypothetical protein